MTEKNTAIPNKNTSIPNKEVADLLAAFDPEVRNLVLATRGFVFQMFPDITEQVDAKGRIIGYGYGPKYTDMVCSMMPAKIGVTLGIAYAMELPDPEKLLEGTGKVHRHVKLKSKSDLEASGLKSLFKTANAAAIGRRARTGQRAKR
jgi:hypothetical protein